MEKDGGFIVKRFHKYSLFILLTFSLFGIKDLAAMRGVRVDVEERLFHDSYDVVTLNEQLFSKRSPITLLPEGQGETSSRRVARQATLEDYQYEDEQIVRLLQDLRRSGRSSEIFDLTSIRDLCECDCSALARVQPHLDANKRKHFEFNFIQMAKILAKRSAQKGIVLTSTGSGDLFQEFVIINKLLNIGFKKIRVNLIDFKYREFVEELKRGGMTTLASGIGRFGTARKTNFVCLGGITEPVYRVNDRFMQFKRWFSTLSRLGIHPGSEVEVVVYGDIHDYVLDCREVLENKSDLLMVVDCDLSVSSLKLVTRDCLKDFGMYGFLLYPMSVIRFVRSVRFGFREINELIGERAALVESGFFDDLDEAIESSESAGPADYDSRLEKQERLAECERDSEAARQEEIRREREEREYEEKIRRQAEVEKETEELRRLYPEEYMAMQRSEEEVQQEREKREREEEVRRGREASRRELEQVASAMGVSLEQFARDEHKTVDRLIDGYGVE